MLRLGRRGLRCRRGMLLGGVSFSEGGRLFWAFYRCTFFHCLCGSFFLFLLIPSIFRLFFFFFKSQSQQNMHIDVQKDDH